MIVEPPIGEESVSAITTKGSVMADQVSAAAARTDRSPWNWLFFIPIVVPLVVVLFNAKTPTLFGFPRFYWLQLCFILLSVGSTTLVYQMTKKPSARVGGR
jgi:hypothetical protein